MLCAPSEFHMTKRESQLFFEFSSDLEVVSDLTKYLDYKNVKNLCVCIRKQLGLS